MTIREFIYLLEENHHRYHFLGDELAGVVVTLDREGRIFAVLEKEVVNRVNPDAFWGESHRQKYLNPGGDVLWPAPEGSRLGYFYTTGSWSVPAGLWQARYQVKHSGEDSVRIEAEVDLVSNSGLGLPVIFQRDIRLAKTSGALAVTTEEKIQYLGRRILSRKELLLAPWTLTQIESGPGCLALFPGVSEGEIQDFYEDSHRWRSLTSAGWQTLTEGQQRYQIGLTPDVEWIEFYHPDRRLRVRRQAEKLSSGLGYVDIADRPADEEPTGFLTRYSIYSDPALFMEMEAAGGCPEKIHPGDVLSLRVTTSYCLEKNKA